MNRPFKWGGFLQGLRSNAGEPVLNSSPDGLTSPLAELVNQPFTGTAVSLRVIAATCAVTERDDVPRDGAGAIGAAERYPVVGGENVPEAGRTPTDRTTTAEMSERRLPVVGGEGIGKGKFASCASRFVSSYFRPIGCAPSVIVLFSGGTIPPVLPVKIGIRGTVFLIVLASFVPVCHVPLVGRLAALGRIGSVALPA